MFLNKRNKAFFDLVENTCFSNEAGELTQSEGFEKVYTYLSQCLDNKNKVYVVGNGGSCGIASHHVVDLLNVLKLSAFALSDNNVLTCFGNDYGYDTIYSKYLDTVVLPGDLLIAISSSGSSKNIINACQSVSAKGGDVITVSGFAEDNLLRTHGDINIWTPAHDYGLVESAHFFILHTFVDGWSDWQIKQKTKNERDIAYEVAR